MATYETQNGLLVEAESQSDRDRASIEKYGVKWRTTPSGHEIGISPEGEVTKGNPHHPAMKGGKSDKEGLKQSFKALHGAMRSLRKGAKRQMKQGAPTGGPSPSDTVQLVNHARKLHGALAPKRSHFGKDEDEEFEIAKSNHDDQARELDAMRERITQIHRNSSSPQAKVALRKMHGQLHKHAERMVREVSDRIRSRRTKESAPMSPLHRLVEAREDDMNRDHMTRFQKLAGIRPTLPSLEEAELVEWPDPAKMSDADLKKNYKIGKERENALMGRPLKFYKAICAEMKRRGMKEDSESDSDAMDESIGFVKMSLKEASHLALVLNAYINHGHGGSTRGFEGVSEDEMVPAVAQKLQREGWLDTPGKVRYVPSNRLLKAFESLVRTTHPSMYAVKPAEVRSLVMDAVSEDIDLDELESELGEANMWVQGAIKRPGRLRQHFGVEKGGKIPMKKLVSAYNKLAKKADKTPEEVSLMRAMALGIRLKGGDVPGGEAKRGLRGEDVNEPEEQQEARVTSGDVLTYMQKNVHEIRNAATPEEIAKMLGADAGQVKIILTVLKRKGKVVSRGGKYKAAGVSAKFGVMRTVAGLKGPGYAEDVEEEEPEGEEQQEALGVPDLNKWKITQKGGKTFYTIKLHGKTVTVREMGEPPRSGLYRYRIFINGKQYQRQDETEIKGVMRTVEKAVMRESVDDLEEMVPTSRSKKVDLKLYHLIRKHPGLKTKDLIKLSKTVVKDPDFDSDDVHDFLDRYGRVGYIELKGGGYRVTAKAEKERRENVEPEAEEPIEEAKKYTKGQMVKLRLGSPPTLETYKVIRTYPTKADAEGPFPSTLTRLIRKGGGALLVELQPGKKSMEKDGGIHTPGPRGGSWRPKHYIVFLDAEGNVDGAPVDLKPHQYKRVLSYKEGVEAIADGNALITEDIRRFRVLAGMDPLPRRLNG